MIRENLWLASDYDRVMIFLTYFFYIYEMSWIVDDGICIQSMVEKLEESKKSPK